MSDYIKREDAINKLADEYVFDARSEYEGTFTRADFIDVAKETLADIPTADVVEVRHGRWLDKTREIGFPDAECSVCGSHAGMFWMNYCPYCGARMDGESDERDD